MSDPYIPPRPGTPNPVGTTPGVTSGTPRDEYSRTNIRVETAADRPVKSGGGFSTGLMVALVFVVIAILAYAMFGNRDTAGPMPATAPGVSIENNAAPAPATNDVAPDVVVPDAVAPDAVVPDAVAPAPGTAAPVAPTNP